MDVPLTDRAYQVLALARHRAQSRSADEIATRDILDGLAIEGSGIAANVMRRLGVRLPDASTGEVPAELKGIVSKERRVDPDQLRGEASDLMLRALAEALQCFQRWGDRYPHHAWIGTEHVLLAMTTGGSESGTTILRGVLADVGLTLDDIRNEILAIIFGQTAQ